MNILVLNWRDIKHPLAGGAEASLYEQIKIWRNYGANVTWFSSGFRGAKNEEVLTGINIIRRGNHFTVGLYFLFGFLSGDYRNFDIVIDCFHFIPFLTPLYIRKKKIVGLINEVAGRIWFENLPYPLALIGYIIEPYLIRLYKGKMFLTGSNSTKRELIKIGINQNLITVIHHGFTKPSSKKFNREKDPTLLFLGRVSRDKGIEDAIKMLTLIHSEYSKTKLYIVGKFESEMYEKKIRTLIRNCGLSNKVRIFGFVTERKKGQLIQKSWILVHPSTKEGWGLNVIEANSLGIPAVGYNVPGLSDSIINKKTGILVDSNIKSLAKGILLLLRNEEKINELGFEAAKWSSNFSWEKAGHESYVLISKYSLE